MELTKVLQAPVLTEKTYQQMSNGVYTFKADYHANKFQIANAVEKIFKVKVEKVNTIKVDKKPKNVGRFHGFTNRYKKAMVTLALGQEINFFPNEDVNPTKEKEQKDKEEKKTLASDVERRVAAKLASKKQTTMKSKVKTTSSKPTMHRKVGGGE
ncbi:MULTISPECIES: 50S ribosomal protein L23 [unclassified Mycoplasma]|uniref:50S ribosomal protein L23 n=1 Tax=unclassified Mycoplasma TaxID=2683645 RepID=UPI00211CFE37|nr:MULTISPECIES: 50S ribosomal protein L23 [unclassified Mycoplasma]UUM19958.1 50S ribosomal protein L23 [Mycoplasma sp. 1578d]UUM24939.1 50S ribosomal protein L23 [Mycoplasma sp. 3686d]